jgi:2,3-bisphosphoglycerate-independent phosphoglycerate mutase
LIKSLKEPLSSNITNSDPAYTIVNGIGIAQANADMVLKTCEPLDDTQEVQVSAALVNEFIKKAYDLWEKSMINMQRVAKGKLEQTLY